MPFILSRGDSGWLANILSKKEEICQNVGDGILRKSFSPVAPRQQQISIKMDILKALRIWDQKIE